MQSLKEAIANMRRSGVYKLFNTVENKLYIGSSVDMLGRLRGHVEKLRSRKHGNKALQTAWDTYGEESFRFEILVECELAEIRREEQNLIDYHRSADPSYGYNLYGTVDGVAAYTPSPVAKEKMSKSISKYWEGADEQKRKHSEASKKRFDDPSYRARQLEILHERWQDPSYSEKQKSAARRRYDCPERMKKYLLERGCRYFRCEQNGKIYLNSVEAAKELGIESNYGAITNFLRGTRKSPVSGFTFAYCEAPDKP